MIFKASLILVIQLFALSAGAIQDCGKDANPTDGGQTYYDVDDCKTRCYCARGSGGDVLYGKMWAPLHRRTLQR